MNSINFRDINCIIPNHYLHASHLTHLTNCIHLSNLPANQNKSIVRKKKYTSLFYSNYDGIET